MNSSSSVLPVGPPQLVEQDSRRVTSSRIRGATLKVHVSHANLRVGKVTSLRYDTLTCCHWPGRRSLCPRRPSARIHVYCRKRFLCQSPPVTGSAWYWSLVGIAGHSAPSLLFLSGETKYP